YVANVKGNSVTPIDLATNTPGAEIEVNEEPTSIAITPGHRTRHGHHRSHGPDHSDGKSLGIGGGKATNKKLVFGLASPLRTVALRSRTARMTLRWPGCGLERSHSKHLLHCSDGRTVCAALAAIVPGPA